MVAGTSGCSEHADQHERFRGLKPNKGDSMKLLTVADANGSCRLHIAIKNTAYYVTGGRSAHELPPKSCVRHIFTALCRSETPLIGTQHWCNCNHPTA